MSELVKCATTSATATTALAATAAEKGVTGNTGTTRLKLHLCRFEEYLAPIVLCPRPSIDPNGNNVGSTPTTTTSTNDSSGQKNGSAITTGNQEMLSLSLIDLETALQNTLVKEGEGEEQTQQPPVYYPPRNDATMLHCTNNSSSTNGSILGFVEEQHQSSSSSLEEEDSEAAHNNNKDPIVNVQLTVYQCQQQQQAATNNQVVNGNQVEDTDDNHNQSSSSSNCTLTPPGRLSWKRSLCHRQSPGQCSNNISNNNKTPRCPLLVEWVDLSDFDNDAGNSSSSNSSFFLPTQASIVHFLRSLLGCSHTSSPWVPEDTTATTTSSLSDTTAATSADCVLVTLPLSSSSSRTQNRQIQQFQNFRVSDACPSWYLHAVCRVDPNQHHNHLSLLFSSSSSKAMITTTTNTTTSPSSSSPFLLLFVYRRLPGRECLQSRHFITDQPVPDNFPGCLWEAFWPPTPTPASPEDDHHNCEPPEWQFRVIAPPYISLFDEYGDGGDCHNGVQGRIRNLFGAANLELLRRDALAIGHWTAWPEQEHYRPKAAVDDGDCGRNNNSSNEEDQEAAPWNVFPLCHCFPANDPSRLTWIPATSAAVPNTVRLLKQSFCSGDDNNNNAGSGFLLRTALFSKLDAGSILEAHTGWSDLANHVLRLHIPLIVPPGGLCGTWVDGCVETHDECGFGDNSNNDDYNPRPVCFDDSKTHRAFNYSAHDRVVLIVDLARPPQLPLGTAIGGHSEELDAFIEQMSLPS